MIRLFTVFYAFLLLNILACQVELDPFSDEAMAQKSKPLLPRRGYPDPLPFTETKVKLISMHIPTIENPPSPLDEMPVVDQVNPDWDHTKAGDLVYDISRWFPLETMRLPHAKSEERWVYYNQTSGYIIANADRFLHSSIYDYVKGNLIKHHIINRLTLHYLEIDDNIPLDLEAINRSVYTTLMKFSGTGISGHKIEYIDSKGVMDIESIIWTDEVNVINLSLWKEDYLELNYRFYLKNNQWVIHECGISSSGKRRVMMIKSESQNLLGQLVHFPAEKDKVVKVPKYHREFDTFEDDDRVEYHIGYSVPPDVIQLFYDSPEGDDPFDDPFGDDVLPEKFRGDKVDVSELFSAQGVKTTAVFDRASSMIVAYATEKNHSMIEELLMTLGPQRLVTNLVKLSFYEIDSKGISEDHVWSIEDLLAGNPVRLGSAGCVTISGERSYLSNGDSICQIELIRNESGTGVDLYLDFKLNFSKPLVMKTEGMTVKYDVPKILKVMPEKNGRIVVMLINVTKILDTDDE